MQWRGSEVEFRMMRLRGSGTRVGVGCDRAFHDRSLGLCLMSGRGRCEPEGIFFLIYKQINEEVLLGLGAMRRIKN